MLVQQGLSSHVQGVATMHEFSRFSRFDMPRKDLASTVRSSIIAIDMLFHAFIMIPKGGILYGDLPFKI